MFDFEKLKVYDQSIETTILALQLIRKHRNIDQYLVDQWKRAGYSVVLNLSEGTGRTTAADKRRFYTIARASVYECVSIIRLLRRMGIISESEYLGIYSEYEKLSKMLIGLYHSAKTIS